MRRFATVLMFAVLVPSHTFGQPAAASNSMADTAKHAYETLFTKTARVSLDPIAPTGGITGGIGIRPKPWRSDSLIKIFSARATASVHKYWAVEANLAWQSVNQWRLEPYFRVRSMKRLSYFGLGNESHVTDRANFAFLEPRLGLTGYKRPIGWLAIGGRIEAMWPRTSVGQNPDFPSVDQVFTASKLVGFGEKTNVISTTAFVNFNYPYVRSERPRRGGDYGASLGLLRDVSGTRHSYRRLELEGEERFPILGPDRVLTIHGRVSGNVSSPGQSVPFYLMETLGGADNLRGVKEEIIGGDEATATLRAYESFRFRDNATGLLQVEFRHRVYAQMFVSVFADVGVVAPRIGNLANARAHKDVGLGFSVYRSNVMAVRVDLTFGGGEGSQRFVKTGRGLQF